MNGNAKIKSISGATHDTFLTFQGQNHKLVLQKRKRESDAVKMDKYRVAHRTDKNLFDNRD